MPRDNRVTDEIALGDTLRPRGPVALTIDEQREGTNVVLCLNGELDILTASRLSSRVQEIVHRDAGDLIVDLGELRFIDSSGLHILLNAQRRLIRRGRRLRVRCVAGPVMRVIELARLTDTLGVIAA
jgi:anti-anti-sigma factor